MTADTKPAVQEKVNGIGSPERDAAKVTPAEFADFQGKVANDLGRLHAMCMNLHQRVLVLEADRPRIQIASQVPPSVTSGHQLIVN